MQLLLLICTSSGRYGFKLMLRVNLFEDNIVCYDSEDLG